MEDVVKIFSVVGAIFSAITLCSILPGAQAVASEQLVEAEFEHRPPPSYPRSQALRGSAGGVEISLMVDAMGKTYDVIASRSSHRDFEKSAIRAAERYVYTPAKLNGEAIPTRQKVVIYYEMEGQGVNEISRRYYKAYDKTQKLLSKDNSNVTKLLSSFTWLALKARTRCDYAMTAMLRSAKPLSTDGDDFRIEQFRRALMFDYGYTDDSTCFGEDQRSYLKSGLLILLIKNQYFGEALYEFEESNQMNLSAVVAQFSEVIANIKLDGSQLLPIERRIVIPARGHYEVELFAEAFSMSGEMEKIDDLALRCQTGHYNFELREDHKYHVPDGLKTCQLQISGKKGAVFEFQEEN